MAIAATMVWEIRATATANNVNGGGFNSARGGTDYTLQDAAQASWTAAGLNNDLASTLASGWLTLTSASGGFTAAMVGNIIHITAGTNFIPGWYEVTAYASANSVTVDRACGGVGNASGGTGYLGGAMSLNSTLDDALFESATAGNIFWIKYGSYTLGESVNITTSAGTGDLPIWIIGYNTNPTDRTNPLAVTDPNGADRPIIDGSFYITNAYWAVKNLIGTGTGTGVFGTGYNQFWKNCKVTNSSGAAGRAAMAVAGSAVNNTIILDTEIICTNGIGVRLEQNYKLLWCYVHDCGQEGVHYNDNGGVLIGNIVDTCLVGIELGANTNAQIIGNTLYGADTVSSVGISATSAAIATVINNIISNWELGAWWTARQLTIYSDYNNWYSNDTDATNYTKGNNETAVDPDFENAGAGDFSLNSTSDCIGAGFGIRLGV